LIEYIIYVSSVLVFFAINIRILRALHIENKFEKMKIWEIKAAYFIIALVIAHVLAEMMLKVSEVVILI
ncbi:MAG: hypothetical protein ACPF9F_02765, partial [Acholeplasmataceae bacterium]